MRVRYLEADQTFLVVRCLKTNQKFSGSKMFWNELNPSVKQYILFYINYT